MSRTTITSKFKMCWFSNEGCYWAGKLQTGINLVLLMSDEDKIFSGPFVLDLRIWWRQAHTLYPCQPRSQGLSSYLSRRIHRSLDWWSWNLSDQSQAGIHFNWIRHFTGRLKRKITIVFLTDARSCKPNWRISREKMGTNMTSPYLGKTFPP